MTEGARGWEKASAVAQRLWGQRNTDNAKERFAAALQAAYDAGQAAGVDTILQSLRETAHRTDSHVMCAKIDSIIKWCRGQP